MSTRGTIPRRHCVLTIVFAGLVVALALLARAATSEHGDRVTYLNIGAKRVDRLSRPASLYGSQSVSVGHIGRTSSGELFCGTYNPVDGRLRLWRIGDLSNNSQRIDVGVLKWVGLSRGAEALWIGGYPGLYKVINGKAEPLTGVDVLRWCAGPEGSGPFGPPELYTTEETLCSSFAVDTSGQPWRIGYDAGPAVHVYVPTENDEGDEEAKWYATCEYIAGRRMAVVAADPTTGVWVYGTLPYDDHDDTRSLVHLDVKGSGEDIQIVEFPDTPGEADVPVLYNPRMTVGRQTGVVIAGETAEGDVLVQVRKGQVQVVQVPLALSHGRRVTAIDTDDSGRVLLATDGAGVLVYDGRDWAVHEIAQYLPVLEGTGLKPVDDILVADGGKLYAAIQQQVIIWQANSEGE